MLAKFSVKKPFTVLVCVILVIILGVVAFINMTPDLMPNIDLPYVVVVTTYAGASPEEVEQVVTKPVEQSVATLDHIKSISSNSNENYSLVIMEFSADADMDAVTMNIREKLDLLAGGWNDYIAMPTILKLNPNMLPLAVAAVSRDGYDAVAMSALYESTLLSALEGVEGVASVSASGLISEKVRVALDAQKLAWVNADIRRAIDEQFKEGESELADARAELEDGFEQLEEGEEGLEKGRKQLSSARRKMNSGFDEATRLLAQGEQALAANEPAVLATIAQLEAGIRQAEEALSDAEDTRALLADSKVTAAAQSVRISALEALAADGAPTPQALAALDLTDASQIPGAIAAARTAKAAAETVIAGINEDALRAGIRESEAARAQLTANRDALQAELDRQKQAIADNKAELAAQKKAAEKQLRAASNKLDAGEETLEDTRLQLDDALTQLDDAQQTLSETKLDAYRSTDLNNILSLSTVSAILNAGNFSMPAGYAEESGRDWLVYVGDKLQSAEELSGLILLDLDMDGLEPIRLSDVADVWVEDNAAETYARINGSTGVLLSFTKQSGYATATVSDNLRAEFDALSEKYPGLSFASLMDQGDYIRLVVSSVLENLGMGALLAVAILLLFLWDFRPTLVTACSIPISVTFAIVLMYFSGVTLNVISMSGLAVGVGMLVDNSIVVIENIYRLRRSGVSANRAAISGAVQVAAAITASTLTTVCVFVPIVFIEGITRQLFTDMALTITYSLLASLIVALTLVPAMASGLLRRTREKPQRVSDAIAHAYGCTLRFALRYKALFIVVVLVLLLGSASAVITRGFTFMPDMDSTQISVTVTLDEDATLDETAAVADEIAARIKAMPDVLTVGAMASQGMGSLVGMPGGQSASQATVYVVLSEDKTETSMALAKQIEDMCADLPCTLTASGGSLEGASALFGSGISVRVYGSDLEEMQRAARLVAGRLAQVEGVAETDDGLGETTPALRVTVDKAGAMLQGLTVAQVYQQVSNLLKYDATATQIEGEGRDVVVAVRQDTPTIADLKAYEMTFAGTDGKYRTVKLSDVASFSESETLRSISRSEQRRQITVSAELADGYNITLVTARAQEAIDGLVLPGDCQAVFDGENETIMQALEDLLLMLALGVVIVYLIMVAQFQSLLSPLIVMTTVPLAFTGGLIALLIAGMEISIVAMIGFVVLVGVIVNNGIVLIDTMNQLRLAGTPRRQAVIEASETRLRPVLMTALTTILGLIPLAVGAGMGASLVQPVAVVSIGGLAYATLMTLYIVPLMYDLLAKKPPRTVTREDLEVIES